MDARQFPKNDIVFNTFQHNELDRKVVMDHLAKLYNDYIDPKNQSNSSPEENLKSLATLPDPLLIYLLVEIKKMIDEKDCFAFEEREPGCIKAFFDGLTRALSNLDDLKISHQLIKELHAINSNPNSVKIFEFMKHGDFSGEYRNGEESLTLSLTSISIEGLEMLLNMVEQNEIKSLSDNRSELILRFSLQRYLFEVAVELIDFIKSHDKKNFDTELSNEFLRLSTTIIPDEIQKYYLLDKKDGGLEDFYTFLKLIKNSLKDELPSVTPEKTSFADFLHQKTDELIVCFSNKDINKILEDLKSEKFSETNEILTAFMNFIAEHIYQYNTTELLSINSQTFDKVKKQFNAQNNKELAKSFLAKLKEMELSLEFHFVSGEHVNKLMDLLINDFNEKVEAIYHSDFETKLNFIASFTQKALLIHPFLDVNNRTFANQIALRFFLQHHLPLAIYFNPFVFYAHDTKQVVDAFKLSMANFLALIHCAEKGNLYFDFYPQNSNHEQLVQIENFVKTFRVFLNKQFGDVMINDLHHFDKTSTSNLEKGGKIGFFGAQAKAVSEVSEDKTQLQQVTSSKQDFTK